MSDYSRQNDFSAKDALAAGNPLKIIKGSDVDDELDAIVTAVATKVDKVSGATQNNVCTFDANGAPQDSGSSISDVLSKSYDFVSSSIALSAGNNQASIAHSLGAVPTVLGAYLVCDTADLNYSVGDFVALAGHCLIRDTAVDYGYTVSADATNVYFTYNAGGIRLNDNNTPYAPAAIDTADWSLVLCAS